MSDEWTNFDINNVPTDLFKKKREWRLSGMNGNIVYKSFEGIFPIEFINELKEVSIDGEPKEIQYRDIQPKAPTHQEIMTKWWKGYKDAWKKVDTYNSFPSAGKPIYIFNGEVSDGQMIGGDRCCVTKSWFIGKQSADIPPE